VKEMMFKDKERDKMLVAAVPPQNIMCDVCSTEMSAFSRMYAYKDKKEEVLFLMSCPSEHRIYKSVFSDGTEYRSKTNICPDFNATLTKESLPGGVSTIKSRYTCSNCDYEKVVSSSLSLSKKDTAEERDFKKYRDKFCLSGQSLLDTQEAALQLKSMKTLFGEQEFTEEAFVKHWWFL
jgi:transposase-like protein